VKRREKTGLNDIDDVIGKTRFYRRHCFCRESILVFGVN